MLAIVEKTPDKIKAATGFEPSSQIQAQPPTDRAMKLLVGNETHLRRFLSTAEKADYEFFFFFVTIILFWIWKQIYWINQIKVRNDSIDTSVKHFGLMAFTDNS